MSKQNIQSEKAAAEWTKDELYRHLQMAIDVEFFTIPLYLTAAYSIKPEYQQSLEVTVYGEQQVYTDPKKPPTINQISYPFPVFDTVFSVAIQEMYHLMWICNLAKAVGMEIKVKAPDMKQLPSVLSLPKNIVQKYKGVANLPDVIDLMVAIETPDTSDRERPKTPQKHYDSIGDMYHSLSYGIKEFFGELNESSYDAYQKVMIADAYPGVAPVKDLQSALDIIGAITEQGEGSGVEGYIPGDYVPKAGGYEQEDLFTHYERFVAIQKNIGYMQDRFYETPSKSAIDNPDQVALIQGYSQLIYGINKSYMLPSSVLETPGMTQVGTALMGLWANGTLPNWVADNLIVPPPIELHICQGLNACAGHGANFTGSMPGDGDCATISHVCQSSNDCRGQGGCGYPGQATVGGTKNVFTPGENSCQALGGCAAPISVWQVFSDPGGPLDGKYVWCEARRLFEARMKAQGRAVGQPGDPTAARLAKSTHSAAEPLKDNSSCPA